ncbi:MAG: hypothetical protein ABSF81_08740 [Bacteroidales bacterium]|jgi:hypothetical protein
MKAQTLHPYDETILGLENLYVVDCMGNFYINSEAIIAHDKAISTGRTYLLVDSSIGKDVKMYSVILLDVYFEDGFVHLNVQDLLTQKKFTIDHNIECPETRCTWRLIDMDYFNKLLDYKTIQSYCEKCNVTKTKPIAESKPEQSNDDLLEFEF